MGMLVEVDKDKYKDLMQLKIVSSNANQLNKLW